MNAAGLFAQTSRNPSLASERKYYQSLGTFAGWFLDYLCSAFLFKVLSFGSCFPSSLQASHSARADVPRASSAPQ